MGKEEKPFIIDESEIDGPDKIVGPRPVDPQFINAMENKLEHGREQGRKGWDSYWGEHTFDQQLFEGLSAKFYEEVREVFEALVSGNLEEAADECPDVANMAMMIWDYIHHTKDE